MSVLIIVSYKLNFYIVTENNVVILRTKTNGRYWTNDYNDKKSSAFKILEAEVCTVVCFIFNITINGVCMMVCFIFNIILMGVCMTVCFIFNITVNGGLHYNMFYFQHYC